MLKSIIIKWKSIFTWNWKICNMNQSVDIVIDPFIHYLSTRMPQRFYSYSSIISYEIWIIYFPGLTSNLIIFINIPFMYCFGSHSELYDEFYTQWPIESSTGQETINYLYRESLLYCKTTIKPKFTHLNTVNKILFRFYLY